MTSRAVRCPRSRSARSAQAIGFGRTKYPDIRRHYLRARRAGRPPTLVLNRPGADARREQLLGDHRTRMGYHDECPPAVGRGRGRGRGLTRGTNPRGSKITAASGPSSENRFHGSTLGTKLGRFCNGTRFRHVFH